MTQEEQLKITQDLVRDQKILITDLKQINIFLAQTIEDLRRTHGLVIPPELRALTTTEQSFVIREKVMSAHITKAEEKLKKTSRGKSLSTLRKK